MAEQAGQQYVMREGGQVTRGREAQTYNIMAAMAVAGSVASTLGPRGMDKMLVDSTGDIIVSNDGATILRKMDIQHPAAKMIVEVAKAQDSEAGDGTTTAVLLAGELLRQAGLLTERSLHEASIIKGYQMAAEKALELVKAMAVDVSVKDRAMLKKIAGTAMTGKDTDNARDFLSDMVVRCMDATMEKDASGKYYVEKKNLVLEKKTGGRVEDSRIIEGVLIDKGRVNFQMPAEAEEREGAGHGHRHRGEGHAVRRRVQDPPARAVPAVLRHGGPADQGTGRPDREAWRQGSLHDQGDRRPGAALHGQVRHHRRAPAQEVRCRTRRQGHRRQHRDQPRRNHEGLHRHRRA